MIKIFFCEFKALFKYILIYCAVIIVIYCMVITFTSFGKSALNDVERIIDDYSKGSNFVIDTSAPYEEVEALIGTDDIYNIKFNFAYESFITTSGTINDESGEVFGEKGLTFFNYKDMTKYQYALSFHEVLDDICLILHAEHLDAFIYCGEVGVLHACGVHSDQDDLSVVVFGWNFAF